MNFLRVVAVLLAMLVAVASVSEAVPLFGRRGGRRGGRGRTPNGVNGLIGDAYSDVTGWTNPTPWDTHREEPDEALLERMEAVISQLENPGNAIFNLHAPPYSSGLDDAPELTKDMQLAYAGRSLVPVGSKSVLQVIEKYQPLLGLHGHIHEGKGTRKLRKTLCINTGSQYEQGILQGAVIELKPKKVGAYILTTG